MQKILVIEDDSHISDVLCQLMRQSGFYPVPAYSGTEAVMLFQQGDFALVLLDLMIPGKTGEEVLEEIRTSSAVPVIALTAKDDKETTVHLLQLGADDYIVKPFDKDELLARIEVQLRRSQALEPQEESLSYKDIVLNLDGYDAYINNQEAGLSKKEFEILHLLMSNPRKVFSKNNLYERVWDDEFFGDDNTLNVHISKLRMKLDAISSGEEYIQTVWGIGFRMKE